jgi:dolichol-phosphate mannosyltransferase
MALELPIDLSVIVPTRNEAENIEPLLARLERALGSRAFDVIVVDDSDDATPQRVLACARTARAEVSLLHREAGEREGGLSGAVAAGFAAARGTWVCVIDADLQHPPEIVPLLLDEARRRRLDLVVATRYGAGGAARGLGKARTALSRGSSLAARALFPRRLRGVSDPMSGFFVVRRSAVGLDALRPTGFKILLELLGRCSFEHIGEVPYRFAERHAGTSKASLREGLRYVRHLVRLRAAGVPRRAGAFAAVGATGLVVNESLLAVLTDGAQLYYLASAVLATQASILWNFVLTERWVYGGVRYRLGWKARLGSFCLACTTVQLATTPLLYLLVSAAAVPYLVANLGTIAASTLLRFALAEGVVWRRSGASG